MGCSLATKIVPFLLESLEQLLAGLTSRDQSQFRDLGYAGTVYLKSDSLDELFRGAGEEDGRIAVASGG